MLYAPFKDYAGFQEIFGMTQHGNGVKSRKNLILLKYLKTPALRKHAITTGDFAVLDIRNMAQLKKFIFDKLTAPTDELKYNVRLINYTFHSNIYETDEKEGSCVDGDLNAIRYIKHEPTRDKIYKMKAGKFIKAIISEHPFGKLLSPEVVNWLCEEFTTDWQSFSGFVLSNDQLFVNKEFGRIYDSRRCEGDFGSCMVNKGFHTFYRDYVHASAAYLENAEGKIIARCIIFNEVYDENDKVWRYAERQYSSDGSDVLKRTLIEALIRGGYIDCYKKVGAGCHDANAIVDIHGNSLSHKQFRINCTACSGDTHSYQDTFKWLSTYNEEAYNCEPCDWDFELDTTYGSVGADDEEDEEDRAYDEYHDCYCDYTITVYVHGREMTCDEDNLGDFIQIGDDYVHEDDVKTCPECGQQYDKYDGEFHSELTDEYYCSDSCRQDAEETYKEENWYYSEYEDRYFENEDDLTKFWKYDSSDGDYHETSISKTAYQFMLDNEMLSIIDGEAYDKLNPETNRPYEAA